MSKINRMKWPHRGILSILAAEFGTSPANIRKALERENPNPAYAARYHEILQERKRSVRNYKKSMREAS